LQQKPAYTITTTARTSRAGGWHSKAERLGGLEIDEQLNFRRLLYRQIGRFLALENSAGVDAALTELINDISSSSSGHP
jgi:hypothetical protein